jgi:hypothetical protein
LTDILVKEQAGLASARSASHIGAHERHHLGERALTAGERALVAQMFGASLNPDPVRIRRRRWWALQPRKVVMAPRGHLHFAPDCSFYQPCFAAAPLGLQGLFCMKWRMCGSTKAASTCCCAAIPSAAILTNCVKMRR